MESFSWLLLRKKEPPYGGFFISCVLIFSQKCPPGVRILWKSKLHQPTFRGSPCFKCVQGVSAAIEICRRIQPTLESVPSNARFAAIARIDASPGRPQTAAVNCSRALLGRRRSVRSTLLRPRECSSLKVARLLLELYMPARPPVCSLRSAAEVQLYFVSERPSYTGIKIRQKSPVSLLST